MSDYDHANVDEAWVGGEGNQVAETPQQDHTQQLSADEDQADKISVDATSHAPGEVPSNDGNAEDVGDYDPESITSSLTASVLVPAAASAPSATKSGSASPAPQAKPPASPQPPVKKPRTAGGFLVEESDSEDDDVGFPVLNRAATGAQQGASPAPSITLHPSTSGEGASHPSPAPQAKSLASAPDSGHGSESGQGEPQSLDSTSRSPKDKVDILEDHVRADPRGATSDWLLLIAEYRARNDSERARDAYERFLALFPFAADVWLSYAEWELKYDNFSEAEGIFQKCLLQNQNIPLWTKYLDYIRRRNDFGDNSVTSRQVVLECYKFVIDNVGVDRDSGKIWADYINFVKSGPGRVGGSDWQDQQKMDQLRKIYQQATSVPIENINMLWREYDQFEMNLNKLTGRKYLAERSPTYMSAKSAATALRNITQGLQRSNVPRLPPAPRFDGYEEYMEQVEIWKRWVAWEKSDPLEIRDEQPEQLVKRVLYVYQQALGALWFWPDMWAEAAQWCLENESTKDKGVDYLMQGATANPESVLLALKHADYIESTFETEENDESKIAKGAALKAPYMRVLDTMYERIKALKDQEAAAMDKIQKSAALNGLTQTAHNSGEDDEENAAAAAEKQAKQKQLNEQIDMIKQGSIAQIQHLSRIISFVWIAYIRAMRRVQGKGKPGQSMGGMRQAFADARSRGRLTSDVYAAVGQMEWSIYKDPAGARIFERGSKLFPEDEHFALEYIKYLHSRDDLTNARVHFETVINKLAQKPETAHKAKPLYSYFHKYESLFGELAQITKLEQRMAELYPDDPKLSTFNARFASDSFNPITAMIVVSPTTQLRPVGLRPTIERTSVPASPHPPVAQAALDSPRPAILQPSNSPKRLYAGDDDEGGPPRKIMRIDQSESQRGASPLKGAAGRRLDQQRRMGGATSCSAAPAPIPRDVTFFMSLLPRPETYRGDRVDGATLTRILADVDLSKAGRNPPAVSHGRTASTGLVDVGRPGSPYPGDSRDRLPPASTTYAQSGRPGSSGSYEPPPAGFPQPGLSHSPFDPNAWQHLGAPPPPPGIMPGIMPGGLPPPNAGGFGLPPPPPLSRYGY